MNIWRAYTAVSLLAVSVTATGQTQTDIDLDDITMSVVEEGAFEARDLGRPDMNAIREMMRNRRPSEADTTNPDSFPEWQELRAAAQNGDEDAIDELRSRFEEGENWIPGGGPPGFMLEDSGMEAFLEQIPDHIRSSEEFQERFESFRNAQNGFLPGNLGVENRENFEEIRALLEAGDREALIELLERLKEEAEEDKEDQ